MVLKEMDIWMDEKIRTAAEQMALDEAMFQFCAEEKKAILRFYLWFNPAVTIGYFDPFPEEEDRPVIRRITGGGLVEHGDDLTFCLALPTETTAGKATTEQRYHWIHECLCKALNEAGIPAFLEERRDPAVGPCFSNPVKWDLVDGNGKKIAGGAQRKSRGAVIHQGSIQTGTACLKPDWLQGFAAQLALTHSRLVEPAVEEVENHAKPLALRKYGSDEWCRNRKFNTGKIL